LEFIDCLGFVWRLEFYLEIPQIPKYNIIALSLALKIAIEIVFTVK